MHSGSIAEDSKAVAARIYRVMRNARRWMTGLELQDAVPTTAIATRISEIRRQLPDDEIIETKQEGRRFYYRWSRIEIPKHCPGQLALLDDEPRQPQRAATYNTGINSAARNRHRMAHGR